MRLVALSRSGQARLCVPDMLGQEGDVLHLAVRTEAIEDLEAKLSRKAGS